MITFEHFETIELRIGTVIKAEPFPEARKPSIKIWVDLGAMGIKTSSAQLTVNYSPESLINKQVVCVTNLGSRKIAGFTSEVLITGFPDMDGNVVLCIPDKQVPNGVKLF